MPIALARVRLIAGLCSKGEYAQSYKSYDLSEVGVL